MPKPNPWRNAVIDALMMAGIYQDKHEHAPRRAILDLISIEQGIALDPEVSEDARLLIDRGRQEAVRPSETHPLLDRAATLIERHEGRREKPYQDTEGVWTVGVGRNLESTAFSDEEISQMRDRDVLTAIGDAETFAGPMIWPRLNAPRQVALVDMAFNVGLTHLTQFVFLRVELLSARYEGAASEMLSSKWAFQVGRKVGQRAWRLAEMMKTGEWVK